MTTNQQNLIFRADANIRIGAGHVMRCLALAQTWKNKGGNVIFITNCEGDTLKQRLSAEGFQVILPDRPYPEPEDWATTSLVLTEHPGSWVVVDGYHFDSAYHYRIKELGHPLCIIDDMAHLDRYHADILLNQNLHAPKLKYSCDKNTLQLLGSDYVMLRREFLDYRNWKRRIPKKAKNILVTLGGADQDNVTLKVVRAMNTLNDSALNLKIIVGPVNPHIESIEKQLYASSFNGQLLSNVEGMAKLMAWADLALSASGSTSWELAFMGLPSLVIVMAKNQEPVAEELQTSGVSNRLGRHTDLTEAGMAQSLRDSMLDWHQRQNMSDQGQKLIDGKGTEKIVATLIEVKR